MEGVSGGVAGRMVGFWNAVSSGRRLAAGSFVFVLREAFLAVGGFSERVYASEEIWLSRAVGRWGRKRGLPFVILRDHPVLTSGRKARWYPVPVLVAVMIGFAPVPVPGPLAEVLLALVPAARQARDRSLTSPARRRGRSPWRDPA